MLGLHMYVFGPVGAARVGKNDPASVNHIGQAHAKQPAQYLNLRSTHTGLFSFLGPVKGLTNSILSCCGTREMGSQLHAK